jgi:SPP1 gp7 family putative phage head morphogenesis protein
MAKIKDNKKPDKKTMQFLTQSAKRTYGLYEKFLRSLPNPDRILNKTADGMRKGLELYEEMELDAQIYSDLQTRKLKVRSFPWDIIVDSDLESDKKQVVELKQDIKKVYRDLVKEIQDAQGKGFAVVDIIYEITDRIGIKKIEGMGQKDFFFSPEWELRVKTDNEPQEGEIIEDNKVVLATFDKRKGNLFGRSLLMPCFWPWYFKKYGWLFWSNYIEKYGQPSIQGTFPKGTPDKEQDKFLEALESIQNDFAFVFPEGFKAELVEAKRTGAGDTYGDFIKCCDRYISKVLLMSTLTSNEAEHGTRAQAEVHKDLTDEAIEDDALWIQDLFNDTIVKWLSEWNHNFTVAPKLVIRYKTDNTSLEAAERDEIVSRIIPVPVGHYYEKYNVPKPSDEDIVSLAGRLCLYKDILKQPAVENNPPASFSFAEFSEEDISDSDQLIILENEYIENLYEFNRGDLEASVDVDQINKLLDKSNSFNSAILNIEKYKSKTSEKTWHELLTVGRLLGEYSVKKQIDKAEADSSFAEVEFDEDEFSILKPKAAIKWFKNKIPVKKDVWNQLDRAAKNTAFYVSELGNLDLINFIKEKMMEALKDGKTFREFKKYLFGISGTHQFFGHMKTSFHMNIMTAMDVQNEKALLRNVDQFPYWRYSAILDGKERQSHGKMHNFVARYDDPVWGYWTPRNGFNCRCRKVIATQKEYQNLKGEAEDNQTQFKKPDTGFDTNPLESNMKTLHGILEKKKGYGVYLNGSVRSELSKKLEGLNA